MTTVSPSSVTRSPTTRERLTRRSAVAGLVIAFASGSAGCAATTSSPALDPAAFQEAAKKLEVLRAKVHEARTETVSLELDAPYMPSAMKARGAVAVRPPEALRMILVGPGGTTAMDLWMNDGRFRFDIPALGRVLRGEPSALPETRKGLPVDFLRWWMFEPLGGRLLAARRIGTSDLEVVLDEPSRVTVATLHPDGKIEAHRRWLREGARGRWEPYEEEWLEATGVGCATVKYRQKSTSLRVTARCEGTRLVVNEAAFEDPEEAR